MFQLNQKSSLTKMQQLGALGLAFISGTLKALVGFLQSQLLCALRLNEDFRFIATVNIVFCLNCSLIIV